MPPRPDHRPTGTGRRPPVTHQKAAGPEQRIAALRAQLAGQPDDRQCWQQIALAYAEAQRPADAVEAFAKAEALGAATASLALPWALALSTLGRHEEAVARLAPVQAARPRDFAMANALGVLLKQAGRLQEALGPLELARRIDPRSASTCQNLGNVHELLGDYAAAAAAFAAGAQLDARNAELWRLHGRALRLLGDLDGALASLERAAVLAPGNLEVAGTVIGLLVDRGEYDKADAAIERARAQHPADSTLEVAAARLLLRRGEPAQAIARVEAVVARLPGDRTANMLLARMLGDGDRRGANEALERAYAAAPDDPEVMDELIESLSRSRYDSETAHLERAYTISRQLMARHPERARRYARSLRTVFQRVLDLDRLAATGTMPQLAPGWLAGRRISALHYELGQVETLEDRIQIVEWHRAWGRREAAGIQSAPRPVAPAVHRARRLRVGFMSSDLRHHPVSYFALPLLELYDRERVEVYCYSFYEGARDQVQARIEGKVDAFRWWPRQPVRRVAEDIARDDLDILFDLGGSTAMNKLEVMAHRPARIGASWLGYPHSAGLEEIDYILTDPYITPADARLLIEKPYEMPESWVTLGKLGFHAHHQVTEGLPEERLGRLTFGTMNNPYKYTPRCIDTWAAVLRAVPGSRFLFVRPEGSAQSFVDNARAAFARRDVDPDRLDFIGVRGKHMPHYNSIDIALDSLPHVGGTTTCEALWMGVPTITLVGPGFPERLSYSNLSNAGLGELCTHSVEDYIGAAVDLAADRLRRRVLRHGLRDMIRSSALGDEQRFVEAFYAKAAEVCAR